MKTSLFVEEVFDMYLMLGLSSLFSQINLNFLKNCYLIFVPLNVYNLHEIALVSQYRQRVNYFVIAHCL